jgi:hypothetical protein
MSVAQDNWVFAFVTAEEFFSETKRYKNPDNAALIAWISNYCSKAPLDKLAQAAYLLTLELRNDPADFESAKAGLLKGFERQCADGDKDACKFLEQTR